MNDNGHSIQLYSGERVCNNTAAGLGGWDAMATALGLEMMDDGRTSEQMMSDVVLPKCGLHEW